MYPETLLYLSQYKNFKGIIDLNTSNKSFLKMSKILKEMNIKNRYFFLYLSQPELQGINPYDKNLSQDIQLKIAYECLINPWYYFREIIRIPNKGSITGTYFELNRAGLALLWNFFNDIRIFLTIPRQCGKTTTVQSLYSYIMFIKGRRLQCTLFTKDDQLRAETLNKLREIRDTLPYYLIYKTPKEKDNERILEYEKYNNIYTTYVAQSNKINAEKIGRGSVVPLIHIDEIVIFNNIHITYPSAMNSMLAAYKMAKEHNQPRGVLITSTAGNLDNTSGKFSYGIVSKSYRFNEKLYDLTDRKELVNIISKSSLSTRIYIEYGFLQLGKDKKDLIRAIEDSRIEGADEYQIMRDLFNIWTRGTTNSPFDAKLLSKLKEHEKAPEYIEYKDEFTFNWYYPKEQITSSWMRSIPIILGVDPSSNVGRDYTSFTFTNGDDGSTIGTMRCNESNVIKISLLIVNFLIKYPNMLAIIERNNIGSVIIDKIIDDLLYIDINPITRLYNTYVQEGENLNTIKDLNYNKGSVRKKFGFYTTSNHSKQGRDFLFKTVLTKSLKLFYNRYYDNTLITEVSGLVYRNGRIDHEEGSHDDTVVSRILTDYVLFFGKHIELYNFYKITKRNLLTNIKNISNNNQTSIKDEYYNTILKKIDDLVKEYERTKIDALKKKLLIKIKSLKSKLPSELVNKINDNEVLRIDSKNTTIELAKKEKSNSENTFNLESKIEYDFNNISNYKKEDFMINSFLI